MSNTRTLGIARYLFLALVATVVSTGLLIAKDWSGSFTLPFEARWGTATLPPGDYTFKINTDVSPYTIKIMRKNDAAFVFPLGFTDTPQVGQSSLLLVRRGRKRIVQSLFLAGPGKIFTYESRKHEHPMLAQGPQLIQRIPIVMDREPAG